MTTRAACWPPCRRTIPPSRGGHFPMKRKLRLPQPSLAQQRQYRLDEIRQLVLEVDKRHRGAGEADLAHPYHLLGDVCRRTNQRIGAGAADEALAVQAVCLG